MMKPFTIYFPQFYPTPTNDEAWGQGFTDWALVAYANVHKRWSRRAPRRGFYDGSDPSVHQQQFEEMRRFGLGGFALYHYWFFAHQELDAVERTLLQRADADVLPWFLVWASEGWSRRWVGDPTPIVDLDARPTMSMIEAHCDHLARCFSHPAYLRVGGRPLFVWYHLAHFERPHELVARYREALARRGFEVYVAHFVKNPSDVEHSAVVDASYLFEPRLFFGMQRIARGSFAKRSFDRVRSLLGERAASRLLLLFDRAQPTGRTYSARGFLEYLRSERRANLVAAFGEVVQEVLSPGWNNVPRYAERFTALEDLPADDFAACLRAAAGNGPLPPLINAWNEWSEGAAVEPCRYQGTRYLDAIASAAAEDEAGAEPPALQPTRIG